jgi:hypothetical protein
MDELYKDMKARGLIETEFVNQIFDADFRAKNSQPHELLVEFLSCIDIGKVEILNTDTCSPTDFEAGELPRNISDELIYRRN